MNIERIPIKKSDKEIIAEQEYEIRRLNDVIDRLTDQLYFKPRPSIIKRIFDKF